VKTITIDGVAFELVDTAGRGETGDRIEADAQELGREQAQHADLTLWCVACDDMASAGRKAANSVVKEELVATKADLGAVPACCLATSAATGIGLTELRRRLVRAVHESGHAAMAPSLSRCRHHLDACVQHLRNAHALVLDEGLPELLALELRLGLETLGEMAGTVYTNDLLDRIFSRFCIGK